MVNLSTQPELHAIARRPLGQAWSPKAVVGLTATLTTIVDNFITRLEFLAEAGQVRTTPLSSCLERSRNPHIPPIQAVQCDTCPVLTALHTLRDTGKLGAAISKAEGKGSIVPAGKRDACRSSAFTRVCSHDHTFAGPGFCTKGGNERWTRLF